jgi:hypothetical protein
MQTLFQQQEELKYDVSSLFYQNDSVLSDLVFMSNFISSKV